GGKIADEKRMRSPPLASRSRTRGHRTATGPMPVMISRSGRWPWRTSRRWPSSVSLSAWPPRKPATSASTACLNSARAPSRNTSVNGSENVPGWDSLMILSWVTAYHSFGGEVEASNTPTIRRLTPSRRHQLPRITPMWDGTFYVGKEKLFLGKCIFFFAGSGLSLEAESRDVLARLAQELSLNLGDVKGQAAAA